MDITTLLKRIANGEDSFTQFKTNITNADQLAEELVAFSNALGGLLIIGVTDHGEIIGIGDDDIRRLNQLIGNVISSNITPPVYPITQIYNIEEKKILVISIQSGINKPYATNKGLYITKAGSDKRKVSQDELRRLFVEGNKLYADECMVKKSDTTDLNYELFYEFLAKDNVAILDALKFNQLSLPTVLENRDLLLENHLTLAGNLIFGKYPQRFNPDFYIDCVYFAGNAQDVCEFS